MHAKLDQAETQRAYSALANGKWQTTTLVRTTAAVVRQACPELQALTVGRYTLKALDLTAIFRPKLRRCPTKHYHPLAGKALPALPLGMLGDLFQTGTGQRLALLSHVLRPEPHAPSHQAHRTHLVHTAAQAQTPTSLLIGDREFTPAVCLRAGIHQMLGRLRHNATFVRGDPPPTTGRGRPATRRPEHIRPCPGTYRGQPLAASVPDATETWVLADGRSVTAHLWRGVYLRHGDTALQAITDMTRRQQRLDTPLTVVTVTHPDYTRPLLLYTDCVDLSAQQMYDAYFARWSIELIPQTAKTVQGLGREFVHAETSCARLPVLALVSATLLNAVAAGCAPLPTGFWDRTPHATPGRLAKHFLKVSIPVPPQLSKKNSATAHLPVGYAARRLPPTQSLPAGTTF